MPLAAQDPLLGTQRGLWKDRQAQPPSLAHSTDNADGSLSPAPLRMGSSSAGPESGPFPSRTTSRPCRRQHSVQGTSQALEDVEAKVSGVWGCSAPADPQGLGPRAGCWPWSCSVGCSGASAPPPTPLSPGSTVRSLPGPGQGPHLNVQPDEGGAALWPPREAPSSSAATAQQVLAEVPALAQHQRVVQAAPQVQRALEVVHLFRGRGPESASRVGSNERGPR